MTACKQFRYEMVIIFSIIKMANSYFVIRPVIDTLIVGLVGWTALIANLLLEMDE